MCTYITYTYSMYIISIYTYTHICTNIYVHIINIYLSIYMYMCLIGICFLCVNKVDKISDYELLVWKVFVT